MFARPMKYGKNKRVTIQTKTKLYEVFVLSVFLYEAECWTLKKVNIEYLQQKRRRRRKRRRKEKRRRIDHP